MVQNGCRLPSELSIRLSCDLSKYPCTGVVPQVGAAVLTARRRQLAPCAFPAFQGPYPDHESNRRGLPLSLVGCEGGKRSGGLHIHAPAGDECRSRPQVCDGQRQGRSGQDQPGGLAGRAVRCGGAQHPRGVHRPCPLAVRLPRSGRLFSLMPGKSLSGQKRLGTFTASASCRCGSQHACAILTVYASAARDPCSGATGQSRSAVQSLRCHTQPWRSKACGSVSMHLELRVGCDCMQDVSGGKPVPVEGTALPLWGLEIDPDRARDDFRAFNARDDGKVRTQQTEI